MSTVRLPAPFLDYACGRSLVCCQEPVRAPCEPESEERIAKRLASSDAGRAYLPILEGGFEQIDEARVFKQVDKKCVHLVKPREDEDGEAGCSLHFLVGGSGGGGGASHAALTNSITRIWAQGCGGGGGGGALAVRAGDTLRLASTASNLGGLVQSVGASWLMLSLTNSADMVALVQASTSLPIMLLSLVAGAVADNLDRRRVMLA